MSRKKIDLGKLNDASFWYPINLLEEEGLGTTYEYLDKLSQLHKFINRIVNRAVIAGLPEKYGFSLDLILFSYHKGATEIHVLDTRRERLNKLRVLLKNRHLPKKLSKITYLHRVTQGQLISLDYYKKHFGAIDFLANSEVVQNWPFQGFKLWIKEIGIVADEIAVFIPNKDNNAHESISHLKSLSLNQIGKLATLSKGYDIRTGYIDMPPFPPGIKRSEKQKGDLQDPRILCLLNVFFCFWRFAQKTILRFLLKKNAHIVYLLASKK